MFRNSILIILSLLLPHLTLVPAYYVHPNCGSVPAFRSAINKAFTFASTTVDLYNSKNENMLEVGDFLFPGDTQQNSIRNLAGLQQIAEYKTRETLDLKAIGAGEAVFICGCSNMQERTEADGKLVHFDPAMNFAEEDDEDYQLCLNGGTVVGTNRILNAYTADFGPEHAQIIRFCPEFLSWIAKQRWKSVLQLQPSWLVKINRVARSVLKAQYKTDVDLASLLEVKILHELTHTTAGGTTVDLAPPPQPGVPMNLGGWLFALSLGAQAWRDGEANGFHGLSGWLISQGLMPQKDGTLVEIGAQTSATATAV